MEMSPTDDLEPVTGSSGDVETGAEGTSAAESGESVTTAPSPSKQTKRDPLVQVLWMLILGIVVLTLVTVVYALVTGVFGTGAPRTMQQYKIENARARIEAGSKERQDWMDYIIALTDNKQYALAQQWIDKGKRTLKNQDTSADMIYMQANLDLAQGKLDSALKNADLGLKTIKTGHDKAVAEWKKTGNPTDDGFRSRYILRKLQHRSRLHLHIGLKERPAGGMRIRQAPDQGPHYRFISFFHSAIQALRWSSASS